MRENQGKKIYKAKFKLSMRSFFKSVSCKIENLIVSNLQSNIVGELATYRPLNKILQKRRICFVLTH